MRGAKNIKRQAILDAAYRAFTLYGFKRTSMDDIAHQTGVSRASLYSHFANKEEIFRSLSVVLHEEALGNAEQCLKDGSASLADRIQGALAAKLGRLHSIVAESPHGAEIIDENSRLCGDIESSSSARLRAILVAALKAGAASGEINLKGAGLTPASAAELLQLSAAGLKQGAADPSTFNTRIHKLIRVFFAGLN
jgi:TetR/AcrR family transcriptional repressor of mexJK operon